MSFDTITGSRCDAEPRVRFQSRSGPLKSEARRSAQCHKQNLTHKANAQAAVVPGLTPRFGGAFHALAAIMRHARSAR